MPKNMCRCAKSVKDFYDHRSELLVDAPEYRKRLVTDLMKTADNIEMNCGIELVNEEENVDIKSIIADIMEYLNTGKIRSGRYDSIISPPSFERMVARLKFGMDDILYKCSL